MTDFALILSGIVAAPGEQSLLADIGPAFRALAAESQVIRLAPMRPSTTPELAFLGIHPESAKIAPGPLQAAVLRIEPASDSLLFQLDWIGLDDGGVLRQPSPSPSKSELATLAEHLPRLRTRSLSAWIGEGSSHLLVAEAASPDLECTSTASGLGESMASVLPKGDGEAALRQFIDDAVNLLGDLEFNHVRREEGLEPLNVLWPWGFGFRPEMPSLPLHRGRIATVVARDVPTRGLARLAGYRTGPHHGWTRGVHPDFDWLAKQNWQDETTVIYADHALAMRRDERWDEISHMLRGLEESFVEPHLALPASQRPRLLVALPGTTGEPGLALLAQAVSDGGRWPFDERIFDEPQAPERPLHLVMREFLTTPG